MDNLREWLIKALMDSGYSEVTESGTTHHALTRAEAEEAADDLIADGQGEGMLALMNVQNTDDAKRAVRSLRAVFEMRAEMRTFLRVANAEKPVDPAVAFAMRGGQPGSWFTPDNSGPYIYGNDARDEMQERLDRSRRQRSAW